MNLRQNNSNEGFIALIIAIVLSFILMVVSVTLNRSGFFARSAILEAEYKETSAALAEACVDVALLKLATNASFVPNEEVKIGEKKCFILEVSSNTIKTTADHRGSVTNLEVVFNPSDNFSIISWTEVVSF